MTFGITPLWEKQNFRSTGRTSQHPVHLGLEYKYEEEAMQLANDQFCYFMEKWVGCIDSTWAESRPIPDITTDVFVVLFCLIQRLYINHKTAGFSIKLLVLCTLPHKESLGHTAAWQCPDSEHLFDVNKRLREARSCCNSVPGYGCGKARGWSLSVVELARS